MSFIRNLVLGLAITSCLVLSVSSCGSKRKKDFEKELGACIKDGGGKACIDKCKNFKGEQEKKNCADIVCDPITDQAEKDKCKSDATAQ